MPPFGLQHTEIQWITGIGVQDAGIRLKHAGFFHYLSNPEAKGGGQVMRAVVSIRPLGEL